MVAHWIGEHESKLRERAEKFGFEVDVADSEAGPIVIEHQDGSEITIVNASDRTGTYGVDYIVDDEASAGVKMNKSSFTVGDYHHESWGSKDGAVEWTINIMKQHSKNN